MEVKALSLRIHSQMCCKVQLPPSFLSSPRNTQRQSWHKLWNACEDLHHTIDCSHSILPILPNLDNPEKFKRSLLNYFQPLNA